MTEEDYNMYFWDVEMFWEAIFVLMNRYFLRKFFLTNQYFWEYILLFYNTSIYDPFHEFNFLKSINHIVSVGQTGYL